MSKSSENRRVAEQSQPGTQRLMLETRSSTRQAAPPTARGHTRTPTGPSGPGSVAVSSTFCTQTFVQRHLFTEWLTAMAFNNIQSNSLGRSADLLSKQDNRIYANTTGNRTLSGTTTLYWPKKLNRVKAHYWCWLTLIFRDKAKLIV